MEHDDISHFSDSTELSPKSKVSRLTNASHEGWLAKARRSRHDLILRFRFRLLSGQGKHDTHPFPSSRSPTPESSSPCRTPLRELRRIVLKDLHHDTHHKGQYVILRLVTSIEKSAIISAVAEDEASDVVMLQLCFEHQEKGQGNETCQKEGCVLLIKEPYANLSQDGDYTICINHASDIIYSPSLGNGVPMGWYRKYPESVLSARDWEKRGIESFRKFEYLSSIECFTKALDFSPTDIMDTSIKFKRSLAFLRNKQFDAALCDLEATLKTAVPSEKILFWKAQTLYKLRRYRQCCETLSYLRVKFPNNATAKISIARAISRLLEEKSGTYNFSSMHKDAQKLPLPHLDHGSYVGPIMIRKSNLHGQGLFTTQSVKAGDLLLCEKSIAHAALDSNKITVRDSWFNLDTDATTSNAQAQLLTVINRKLHQVPSLSTVINSLPRGPSGKVQKFEGLEKEGSIESAVLKSIVATNFIRCPRSSYESHTDALKVGSMQVRRKMDFCGIWPTAAYLNHSCFGNVQQSFVGDMMIVRAMRDLRSNTEITIRYQSFAIEDYHERQRSLERWAFRCTCDLCKDHSMMTEAMVSKTDDLTSQLLECFCFGLTMDTMKAETILTALKKLYPRPALEVPRLRLWRSQLVLAQVYDSKQMAGKTIEWALKALKSLGFVVHAGSVPWKVGQFLLVEKWGLAEHGVVTCWLLLAKAYRAGVAPEMAEQAVQLARRSYEICVGEQDSFDGVHAI